MSTARILAALAAGAAAAVLVLMAALLPFELASQARQDRVYYRQFRQAAAQADAYSARHGRLPPAVSLRRLGGQDEGGALWDSLSYGAAGCGDQFKQEARDRYALSFWRGEWTECFAHPSGRTSLPMSVTRYLQSGLGLEWLGLWIAGLACGYAAVRLARPGRGE